MKNIKAFTLVELIVVVTILAILSTIGFVSYSGYLAGVRDTNRIAQLKAIGDALHLYSTNKSLPTPDDKIDIKVGTGVNEKIISYQGYVGKDVIETVGYTAEGLDPKDKTYFSYYLTKDKKYFQLMAFLEEEQNLSLNLNNKIQAEIDYSIRYPRVEGAKLGILTGTGVDLNKPLNELINSGNLNIDTNILNLIANYSNDLIQNGTNDLYLEAYAEIGGNFKKVKGSSCNSLLKKYGKIPDGKYKTSLNGMDMEVYCDMSLDGGGWTLVAKTSGSDKNAPEGSHGKSIDDVNISNLLTPKLLEGHGGKLSDIKMQLLLSEGGYVRIECDENKVYGKADDKNLLTRWSWDGSGTCNMKWNANWENALINYDNWVATSCSSYSTSSSRNVIDGHKIAWYHESRGSTNKKGCHDNTGAGNWGRYWIK